MKDRKELMKADSELDIQSEWVFASNWENVYQIRYKFSFPFLFLMWDLLSELTQNLFVHSAAFYSGSCGNHKSCPSLSGCQTSAGKFQGEQQHLSPAIGSWLCRWVVREEAVLSSDRRSRLTSASWPLVFWNFTGFTSTADIFMAWAKRLLSFSANKTCGSIFLCGFFFFFFVFPIYLRMS